MQIQKQNIKKKQIDTPRLTNIYGILQVGHDKGKEKHD